MNITEEPKSQDVGGLYTFAAVAFVAVIAISAVVVVLLVRRHQRKNKSSEICVNTLAFKCKYHLRRLIPVRMVKEMGGIHSVTLTPPFTYSD